MARGFAMLVGASAAGGVAIGLGYGPGDGLLMGFLLLMGGAPGIVGAHVLARRRALAGSLERQLTAATAVTVILTAIGVATVGAFMFISVHDAFVMVVLLAFAGLLTAYGSRVLAGVVLQDIRAVRDGVRAVGDGNPAAEIKTEARDEVAELAQAANRMAGQLAEREAERDMAEKARRELIAAVSHDLRTPLTSMRLLSDAVEDDLVDPETRSRYLAQMSVHLGSLSALIEDLFELSRLEAGDVQWSMQQVALDELVRETVEAMRPHADHGGVEVRAEVNGSLAPARANPEKLQRVLFNLIQNAIRHTPADGSVTVRAEKRGSCVEVEVADTGEGVGDAERGQVFEPFFRGGQGKSRTGEGAGLGLTICRAIVEAHGGRIWLADSEAGTRVRFSLPAVPGELTKRTEPVPTGVSDNREDRGMPSPHRILVVANRTCPCPALRDEIRIRAAEHDAAEVLIVAPALNSSKLAHWVSDTDEAVGEAEARLAETVEALRRAGVEASGRVGDADPFNAIQDSLVVFEAHEVLISTHPPGDSHWLEADLPNRTREAFSGPVAHVTSEYGVVRAT